MTSRYTPLDIETGSADDLYRLPPDPSYVRLFGDGSEVLEIDRPGEFFRDHPTLFRTRQPYVTVNGHLFDFPALDRHCGIPVEQTIPFSRDLRVAAFQHDPPTTYQTKSGPGFKSYSMDALGERYLGVPKSDLGKALAKEYGGWDRIPADDPRYAEYLRADLDLTRRLDQVIPWDPYEQREAWVATITARITLSGFRADVAGLQERVQALAERAAEGRGMLAQSFGFPLTNRAGKEAKAPQRTKEGKAAFERALTTSGFPLGRWPRGKDGSLSLSKETMEFARDYADREGLTVGLKVIEAVQEMNGIRNSAANVLSHVTDGRAHYTFEPFQSTGRWSFGLTVLKKGTEDSEREFLIAEEGHLLGTIDLDQIDIRCVAAHSQDHALIALLNDPARDIHTEISERAGVPRKQGKTLDLGWLYGRTVNGLAQTPGMTRDAAERVDAYMRSEFGRVMRWQDEVRERGGAGLLLDNGFGRHLRVEAERAFTQAPALMGQSTTRDLIAEGLLDIARKAPEILPLLRGIAHDEVIFSAPEKDFEEVARTVQSCLTRQWAPAGASYPVSITAGNGKPFVSGKTWNSLYV